MSVKRKLVDIWENFNTPWNSLSILTNWPGCLQIDPRIVGQIITYYILVQLKTQFWLNASRLEIVIEKLKNYRKNSIRRKSRLYELSNIIKKSSPAYLLNFWIVLYFRKYTTKAGFWLVKSNNVIIAWITGKSKQDTEQHSIRNKYWH